MRRSARMKLPSIWIAALSLSSSIDVRDAFSFAPSRTIQSRPRENRRRRTSRSDARESSLYSNRIVEPVDGAAGVGETNGVLGDGVPTTIEDMGVSTSLRRGGTQSQASASLNLGKCICGAGSFALPHVFLTEGLAGGTLAMTACAVLASSTMQSINDSRQLVSRIDDAEEPSSYVELAERSLGPGASTLVFTLTMAASLGVCSTYIVFIGQTLASLSSDAVSGNIVHTLAPDVPQVSWEVGTALAVLPLSLVRNYGVFKITSALGVTAVLGGIVTTLAYGLLVDPGGGLVDSLSSISEMKMWPDSLQDAFGGSFGTIAYLFWYV